MLSLLARWLVPGGRFIRHDTPRKFIHKFLLTPYRHRYATNLWYDFIAIALVFLAISVGISALTRGMRFEFPALVAATAIFSLGLSLVQICAVFVWACIFETMNIGRCFIREFSNEETFKGSNSARWLAATLSLKRQSLVYDYFLSYGKDKGQSLETGPAIAKHDGSRITTRSVIDQRAGQANKKGLKQKEKHLVSSKIGSDKPTLGLLLFFVGSVSNFVAIAFLMS